MSSLRVFPKFVSSGRLNFGPAVPNPAVTVVEQLTREKGAPSAIDRVLKINSERNKMCFGAEFSRNAALSLKR
jgi:hypothetical protein